MTSENATSFDVALGAAIRTARFSRGMTQDDLAARLGLTRAAVASYETGRRKIAAETLVQIARICQKPLSFFDPAGDLAPPVEQPSITAIVEILRQRPDAVSFVSELLNAFLQTPGVVDEPARR